MGMIGKYARVTPTQLDRALGEPVWALEHAYRLAEGEGAVGAGGEPWYLDIDKSWWALGVLLDRAAGETPANPFLGGEVLGDLDWGQGPARFLSPASTAEAAATLAGLPFARLAEHFDADDLNAEGIYPRSWHEGDQDGYLRPNYQAVTTLFAGAAGAGDAVLLWVD
ncbi:YfbM family protein [Allonocardiopsis opalescens]|uniref:Uncharacterized protein DUF1877 n=1 Tax=Allonocardiopsis opalescens TaxID=1144618 RepID=A0A2T0Q0M9_9ACTN|nr:YfbM family protein [Allonocardiopsis opalescens]PRX97352.1 uncharacterized protein DUF1877 [Allonocardiopsis opalescens]